MLEKHGKSNNIISAHITGRIKRYINMRKAIEKPFRVNNKLYGIITIISCVGIGLACYYENESASATVNVMKDIIKNISFGCLASTVVAWLLEIYNVREKNQKVDQVYDAVYIGLKVKIQFYIQIWSELYQVGFGCEKDEKHTWLEWYGKCKELFKESEKEKQERLLTFFMSEVERAIERTREELQKLREQKYILVINDVCDQLLRSIIEDYYSEFYGAGVLLRREGINAEDFWKHMDAINDDLKQYIDNWVDIRYYNEMRFAPYQYMLDKKEIARAILKTRV